ncbi:flavodoxin family protein [Kitasatospora sp. CMC57]|uniref:Flavodoxin family protein n=1 Tax=Kitasatospora sp. CMC57 TaxID=3231513 RepID=A0AB33KD95_9ACTN
MHAVIVYESMYGNTRRIAEAVAEGVHEAAPDADVRCLEVSAAGPEVTRSADLLVVGGPTHMHGMSSGLSRRLAASPKARKDEGPESPSGSRPEPVAATPGLRSWFHALPDAGSVAHAAAFDTRGEARGSGGAAGGIARRLAHHHFDLVADPEGFVVQGAEGPLREGELARAREWGRQLV